MGSDGVMQALIKGWEMFSLWFNLVLLNYINMYRRSHTHTQKSCYISIPSQSGGLKQRKERLDFEDGFSWAFKSAHVNSIFIVGHTEPLMSSWRASWLKLCCLRGHTLENHGADGIGFMCRADVTPSGHSLVSGTCADVLTHVWVLVRHRRYKGVGVLIWEWDGVPLCDICAWTHETTCILCFINNLFAHPFNSKNTVYWVSSKPNVFVYLTSALAFLFCGLSVILTSQMKLWVGKWFTQSHTTHT